MTWYLKKNDGEVYGPVDLATLQLWATDGRVAPDDQVSETQKTWSPAPDLPDLSMDWTVELSNGSHFGPLHILTIKELILQGSVLTRAPVVNRKTGEAAVACDILIPVLCSALAERQARIEDLAARAAKPVAPAAAPDAGAAKAAERVQELEKTAKELRVQLDEARGQAAKWKKLCEDEQAAALQRAKEPKAPAVTVKVDEGAVKKLQQEVEKWKKLYEQERSPAQAEKMKAKTRPISTAELRDGDTVPRQQLEEVKLRLAQVERSYQQLLRTLNRNLPQAGGGSVTSADTLRRRDVG